MYLTRIYDQLKLIETITKELLLSRQSSRVEEGSSVTIFG